MMNSTVIISGEASETDSEDDNSLNRLGNAVQGSVIVGEDSESEDESGSISSAISAIASPPDRSETAKAKEEQPTSSTSLLHKKLRESNLQFSTNLNSFCQSVIDQANRQLSTIDRQLLQSQITLQSAVTSFKSINANSSAIRDKLDAIVTSNFLTNVRTNDGATASTSKTSE